MFQVASGLDEWKMGDLRKPSFGQGIERAGLETKGKKKERAKRKRNKRRDGKLSPMRWR